MAKAYFKYVGGKQRLVDLLRDFYPPKVQERPYHEPFCGAATVFFDIMPHQAWLNDKSWIIACTHQMVRDKLTEVLHKLSIMQREHSVLPYKVASRSQVTVKLKAARIAKKKKSELASQEEYYYYQRHLMNRQLNKAKPDMTPATAARFIYLIRACHGGVWRVNSSGQMNCPWGRYRDLNFLDLAQLTSASAALAGANISCLDFMDVMEDHVQGGDFVYLDPPYDGTYDGYTKDGFTAIDQARLAECTLQCVRRGAHVVLTNANTGLMRRLYTEGEAGKLVAYHEIIGPRSVSRDPAHRTEGAKDALIVSRNLIK